LAGVVVRREDNRVDLYTAVDGRTMADQLPPPGDDQLAGRLIKVTAAQIFPVGAELGTRGLPDQYPPRLDNAVAAPIPGVPGRGATLFAVNRRGGPYRDEDRLLALMLGREVALGIQGATLG